MTLSNFDSVTPNEDVINLQAEYEKKFQKKSNIARLSATAEFTFLPQLEL